MYNSVRYNRQRGMSRQERVVFACLFCFLLLPNLVGTFVAQDLLTIGQRIIYLITSIAIYTLAYACSVAARFCTWRHWVFCCRASNWCT